MRSTNNRYISTVLTGAVLTGVLSACSGGGGSSDDNSAAAPAAPSAKPVAVTPANASKVSAEAYFGVVDAVDFGDGALRSAGITAAVVSSDDASFNLFTFTRQLIARLPELNAQYGADIISAVAIPPETLDCENGGTKTISGEASNSQVSTAGDTLIVKLNNCDDLSGVLNGQISLRLNSISENSSTGMIEFNALLTMEEFSVTFASQTWTSNGDLTLESSINEVEENYVLSGTAFTVARGNKSSTLRNFSIEDTYNVAVDSTVTETNGTVESAAIGGSVSFATTNAFQRLGNSNYPFEGAALISGADGSSTRLIVIDSVNVRLDIDADGDNSVEESIATTWAELNQL